MGTPSDATIKRLYAVSGNRCAFPECKSPLVHEGKVTGRICHIKGNKPASKRYDPNQSEEARQDFDNLVLMCPIHHDVIDADEVAYTVERLVTLKAEREQAQAKQEEPSDSVVQQFVANLSGNTITHGSLIFTQNQMGGQVAHSITNVGPQSRKIPPNAANVLISELSKYPSGEITVTGLLGDSESCALAYILSAILEQAGWDVMHFQSQIIPPPSGIQLRLLSNPPNPAYERLLNWLGALGFKPLGGITQRQGAPFAELVVGSNS